MPMYFFDVHGEVSRPDYTGLSLADVKEAWNEALQYVADLQAESGEAFKKTKWSLVVTDAKKYFLFRLDFESSI